MYEVAVLDDNKAAADRVAELVRRRADKYKLNIRQYTRLAELSREMTRNRTHFDIVFMDIQLADGEPNGIDAVQVLFGPTSGTQVVYVSGRADMHAKVYRTKHISFLTKPVNEGDLDEALDRAMANLRGSETHPITVHVGRTERKIVPRDITYIESKGRVIEIHLADPNPMARGAEIEVVRTYMQLGEVGELLGEGFMRVHQSYLVNLDAVVELGTHTLTLRGGARVPVSRSRTNEVRDRFFEHVRGL